LILIILLHIFYKIDQLEQQKICFYNHEFVLYFSPRPNCVPDYARYSISDFSDSVHNVSRVA